MSKRGLDDKSGEPPAKKGRTHNTNDNNNDKPDLSHLWTRTDAITGKKGTRLFKKDLDYRLRQSRRRSQKARKEYIKDEIETKRLELEAATKKLESLETMTKTKTNTKKNQSNKTKTKTKTKSKSGDGHDTDDMSDYDDTEDEDIDISSDNQDEDVVKFHLKTKRFKGHVCVITGAGSNGVGRAIATRLTQEGGRIIILDHYQYNNSIDHINSQLTKDSLKLSSIEGHKVDVRDDKQVSEIMQIILKKYGYIDVLINCASTHGDDRGKITEEISLKDFHNVLETNILGTFNMCKHVLPVMVKEGYGRVVNMASLWGKEGREGHLEYSASAAGIIAGTKVMAKEYANVGITVNCVAPAFIDTKAELKSYNLRKKELKDQIPVHRCGELEEIAGVVAFVASEENTYTTGFCYDVSGGVSNY